MILLFSEQVFSQTALQLDQMPGAHTNQREPHGRAGLLGSALAARPPPLFPDRAVPKLSIVNSAVFINSTFNLKVDEWPVWF